MMNYRNHITFFMIAVFMNGLVFAADDYYAHRHQAEYFRSQALMYKQKNDAANAKINFAKAGDAYFRQGLGDDYENAATMFAEAQDKKKEQACYRKMITSFKRYIAKHQNQKNQYLKVAYLQIAKAYEKLNEPEKSNAYYYQAVDFIFQYADQRMQEHSYTFARALFNEAAKICAKIHDKKCEARAMRALIF